MHGLDAHAARDTYPGLIVREVMEKVHRNVKSRLNAFVSVLGAILQLYRRLKLINTDEKKKWLVAISPYLVTTQDDRGLRNVWESATRCMGALGLGHRRFLYSYRSCTKDTQKLSVYLATYAAFISCPIVQGQDRGL